MGLSVLPSGVGKDSFAHHTSSAAKLTSLPLHPAAAYLARLAPSSRHTMAKLLRRLLHLLGSTATPDLFPWARLTYPQTLALRQTLDACYAPNSANLALAALRGVLREAWRLGQMSHEEFRRATDLAAIRGDRLRPHPAIDVQAIEQLLASCERDRSPRGRRDLSLLSVLYATGLRRAELTGLDLAHVSGERVTVFGKGGQWRVVYLTAQAQRALAGWLAARGREAGALFVAIHRSGRVQPTRLSTEAVARIVERRAQQAGIGQLRPHDLRRAMATHLLQHGVDLLAVQRILGHQSVATTQAYDRRHDRASHDRVVSTLDVRLVRQRR